MTTLLETSRELSIIWGVIPVLVDSYNSSDEIPELAKNKLIEMKIINENEKFIITGGVPCKCSWDNKLYFSFIILFLHK